MSPADAGTTPASRDRGATLRLLALGGLAAGAVLALVSGSRAWWRAAGVGVSVSFSGTEATGGLAQALALVVLAGALLALVLRSRGRRVLGVLLVLAGAGAVVVGLTRPRPSSGTVQSRVLEVSLADQFALLGTPWPYVYAFAGLAVAAAALLTTLTAPRWPSRAARYERPVPGEQVVAPGTAPAADPDADPAALWRLLDAGVDPTDATARDTDTEGDADHRAQPPGPGRTNQPPSTTPPADVADEALETDRETDADTGTRAHPSGRADVHEQPSGVTMSPRAAARTDERTT